MSMCGKTKGPRAWGCAQLLTCLLRLHEALGSVSSTARNWMCSANLSHHLGGGGRRIRILRLAWGTQGLPQKQIKQEKHRKQKGVQTSAFTKGVGKEKSQLYLSDEEGEADDHHKK